MTFVAAAVIWAGYAIAWWGWEAITDHVPVGPPDQFHWPSIRDLVIPGRAAYAVPTRNTSGTNASVAGLVPKGDVFAPGTPGATGDAGNITLQAR